jgi:hypothetical protein
MPNATETKLWHTLTREQQMLVRDGRVRLIVEINTGGLICHHCLTGIDGYGDSPRLALEAMERRISQEQPF